MSYSKEENTLETSTVDSVEQPDPEAPQLKGKGEAFDAVLTAVGEMGVYQVLLFLMMLPAGLAWAFVYFGQMFLTATPQQHWCFVPELAGLDPELRRNLSIPYSNGAFDLCNMFDADWSQVAQTLQPPSPGTPVVPCQNGWEFLFDDIPYSTIVNEREWVCGRAYLVPVSQGVGFLGSVMGGILFGWLADKFGRRPVLVLSNLVGAIGCVATIFSSGFWDFAACRLLVGASMDSCFMMVYIIAMEYVGIKHRTWVANASIALFFGGGSIMLPFMALWIADWRMLSLAMAAPMVVVLFAPLVMPESARWYITRGRVDDAVNQLKVFERINKKKIPDDVMDTFITVSSQKSKTESLKDVMKNRPMRIMLIVLTFTSISTAVSFDVLIRLSETLGGDFFITFAVASATELPSIAILVLILDRVGRRSLVSVTLMIIAGLCITAASFPRGIIPVVLAIVARFVNNMTYNAIIQWTPELFPTGVRAMGSSFIHILTFTGLSLAPFIVFSENTWTPMPLVIIGVTAVLGGALALLLPETGGRSMPQTLADGAELALTSNFARLFKQKEPGCVENVSKTKVEDTVPEGDGTVF